MIDNNFFKENNKEIETLEKFIKKIIKDIKKAKNKKLENEFDIIFDHLLKIKELLKKEEDKLKIK